MLKNLANLIQKPFPAELQEWIVAQEEYFLLLERDLFQLINNGISIAELRRCYKNKFINDSDILETIYEVHLGAILSRFSPKLIVHPKKDSHSKKLYDFRVTLSSINLNFEMKTRKDMFPFTPGRRELFASGRQETVDRRFLGGTNDGTPESTIIRQIIDEALIQLPDIGLNFVAVGQISAHNVKDALVNIDKAIFGDIIQYVERRNPNKLLKGRLQNGIFNSKEDADRYKKLNGVIWQYLEKDRGKLKETSCVFFNDNSLIKTPIDIEAMLKRTFIKNMVMSH